MFIINYAAPSFVAVIIYRRCVHEMNPSRLKVAPDVFVSTQSCRNPSNRFWSAGWVSLTPRLLQTDPAVPTLDSVFQQVIGGSVEPITSTTTLGSLIANLQG